MVERLENSVVELLASQGIAARGDRKAPGVYVDDAKIAALGLRVRRGFTYHGIALNVAMDLSPFKGIDPCGYRGLRVTDLSELGVSMTMTETADRLIDCMRAEFRYNSIEKSHNWNER